MRGQTPYIQTLGHVKFVGRERRSDSGSFLKNDELLQNGITKRAVRLGKIRPPVMICL
jgi:hypothetical protein